MAKADSTAAKKRDDYVSDAYDAVTLAQETAGIANELMHDMLGTTAKGDAAMVIAVSCVLDRVDAQLTKAAKLIQAANGKEASHG